MEHHLTLETGNYFLLGISPSIHFFLEYPMQNIQIYSVLLLDLLLELYVHFQPEAFQISLCFLTKNSFFAMSPQVNKYMELMLK